MSDKERIDIDLAQKAFDELDVTRHVPTIQAYSLRYIGKILIDILIELKEIKQVIQGGKNE